MTNILKNAGNAIAKALGATPKPCLPHGERAAAHAATMQAHRAKREESEASAAAARGTAEADYKHSVAEIERERVADIATEHARISDLFATHAEKQAMRGKVSQRINETAQRKRGAAEVERDARLSQISAEVGPVFETCAKCIAEAEETYATSEREVRKRLLADFNTAVAPALEAWLEAPTKARAEPIGRIFWEHHVRAKRELGAELVPDLIAFALANVLGAEKPGIANKLGVDWEPHMPIMQAVHVFAKSLEQGAAEINKALHLLQEALENLMAQAREPEERLLRRYAVKKGCATQRDQFIEFQAFDKEEERKAHEARVANPDNNRKIKAFSPKEDKGTYEYEDGGIVDVYPGGRRVVIKEAGHDPFGASA